MPNNKQDNKAKELQWLTTARALCETLGLKSENLYLMRVAMNALVHLPLEGVVLRFHHSTRTESQIRLELHFAQFMGENGVPSIQPDSRFSVPLSYDGHFVTVWRYYQPSERPTNTFKLFGGLLKEIHQLSRNFLSSLPDEMSVPNYDPLRVIRTRLNVSHSSGDSEVTSYQHDLLEIMKKVTPEVESAKFIFPETILHGDAHTGNVLWNGDQLYLLDFENVSIGPSDFDLIPTCIIKRRFKPETDLEGFLKAYRHDLRYEAIDNALLRLRELFMLAWLYSSIPNSQTAKNELGRRIKTIQSNDDGALWSPK